MLIKIDRKGIIYALEEGQEDRAIGSLFDNAEYPEERVIECGSEILPVVEDFIQEVNSGVFKPRASVKRFEEILKKYAV